MLAALPAGFGQISGSGDFRGVLLLFLAALNS